MGLLNTVLTDGGTRRHRVGRSFLAAHAGGATRRKAASLLTPRKWSERVIILLVMQSLNNSITVLRKRTPVSGVRRLTSVAGRGRAEPDVDPGRATEAAEQLAENVGGVAGGTWGDLMNIPMTAHFIGGCAIGDSGRHWRHRSLSAALRLRRVCTWLTVRRCRRTSA